MYSLKKLQEDKQAKFYDIPYYDASDYTDNIRILGIYYGINDKVIINIDGIITMSLIRYNELAGDYFFVSKGKKHYFSNMIHIDRRL